MTEISIFSPPQLTLLKALLFHKRRFNKLCGQGGGKTLLSEHLAALVEEFRSHWSRIDYIAVNLGHEPVTPRCSGTEKLLSESKARLAEVSHWLKELGFRFVAEHTTKTLLSGANSSILTKDWMAKNEICLVLNEGIDYTAKSPVTTFVECQGEGIQQIAIDIKRIMPNGFDVKDAVLTLTKGGFTFMTRIFEAETPDEYRIFQCSTDEVEGGFFFSLVERYGPRGKFAPEILEGLYEALEKNQEN